jgi:Photoprotection regulator fluorescence recovery protein
MASSPRPDMRNQHWSKTEKEIARKAFEKALQQEFDAVILTTKKMAAKIEQPQDLWDLEAYLTKSRQEIDRQYDYRYSILTRVFGILIREGRLRQEDLRGLGEDKLHDILGYASL